MAISRRSLVLVLSAPALLSTGRRSLANVARMVVYRDENCGCCGGWVDHIQAAAVPHAALTAWQSLFDAGNLVSGQTGSGKSVALRSAVLQLARDPDNRLVLVDGKMGEGLAGLAHLPGVVGPVAIDAPAARAALGWAAVQMRERYQVGNGGGRVVVVVDEFQEWSGDAVFVDLMRKLAAQGRAAHVHLIAATQHPAVDAFGDSTTRRNLTGKLALRVGDPDASRVAVGGNLPRADYLLGAGDAYAVGPGACHRVQMAYVGQPDIDAAAGGEWEIGSLRLTCPRGSPGGTRKSTPARRWVERTSTAPSPSSWCCRKTPCLRCHHP